MYGIFHGIRYAEIPWIAMIDFLQVANISHDARNVTNILRLSANQRLDSERGFSVSTDQGQVRWKPGFIKAYSS